MKDAEFPLTEEQGQHDELEYLCNPNPGTAVYFINRGPPFS